MFKSNADFNKESHMPNLANHQKAIKAREENRSLRAKCSEYEKSQEQLKLKVKQLKSELEDAQKEYVRCDTQLLYRQPIDGRTSNSYILHILIETTGPPPAPTGPPPAPTTGPPPDHRRCTTCTHRHIGPLMHHRRTTAVPPPDHHSV
ncbi:hypothetical protein LXL04_031869 [Taraxacum kok-saghyz]